MAKITIDRERRAKLGALVREDRRLTGAAVRVGQALLFKFMGALGRAWPSYETLAQAAGVSRRAAVSAVAQLVKLGYLSKTRRWGGNRHIKRAGRWVPHQRSNLYLWVMPFAMSAISSPKPRPDSIPIAQAPLPDALTAVLARFGNAIADQTEVSRRRFAT